MPGPAARLSRSSGQKHDHRRRADRRVLTGEGQRAAVLVAAESGDRVAPLVAGKEKAAAGIDAEAPRIIAARPLLAEQRQDARLGDREPGDAVVQPVGGIHELSVGRDHDLRGEIGAGESLGQAGNRLSRRQPPALGVVGEDGDRRGFLLQRIEPAAAGMESEMPRPIAGRQGDKRRVVFHQPPR